MKIKVGSQSWHLDWHPGTICSAGPNQVRGGPFPNLPKYRPRVMLQGSLAGGRWGQKQTLARALLGVDQVVTFYWVSDAARADPFDTVAVVTLEVGTIRAPKRFLQGFARRLLAASVHFPFTAAEIGIYTSNREPPHVMDVVAIYPDIDPRDWEGSWARVWHSPRWVGTLEEYHGLELGDSSASVFLYCLMCRNRWCRDHRCSPRRSCGIETLPNWFQPTAKTTSGVPLKLLQVFAEASLVWFTHEGLLRVYPPETQKWHLPLPCFVEIQPDLLNHWTTLLLHGTTEVSALNVQDSDLPGAAVPEIEAAVEFLKGGARDTNQLARTLINASRR